MRRSALCTLAISLGIILMTYHNQVEAYPIIARDNYRDGLEDESSIRVSRQFLLGLFNILEHDLSSKMYFQTQKRGFDFGLSRGYSGAEVTKHKLGLAAARNPWGPGRKKRSVETVRPTA